MVPPGHVTTGGGKLMEGVVWWKSVDVSSCFFTAHGPFCESMHFVFRFFSGMSWGANGVLFKHFADLAGVTRLNGNAVSSMRATLPVAGPATFPEIPLVTLVTSGF